METVLECKNLTKKYITKTALKGIDLSVPQNPAKQIDIS